MARKETNFKQTDLGLIPHDWEVVSLGEYTRKIGSGKTPRGGEAVYTLSGIPFVRSQNVGYGRMHLKGLSYISTALHNEQKSSEIGANDVLLNITGASIGRCSVADKYVVGGNVNQHVCIIRVDPSSFTSSFLCNFLLSNNGQEQIQLLQSGGSREGINFGQLGNIKVPLPPTIEEQRRIAEVLSHFDEHIDNLVALLEKRKQVKAATMHALLSGSIRLPGFTTPWVNKYMFEFTSAKRGEILVSNDFKHGAIPVIGGGTTIAGFHNKANREGKTITISASGANAGYVGFYTMPIFASDCCTLSESKVYDIEYLYQYLKSIQTNIYRMQTGGAQPHIYPKDIESLWIFMPSSVAEQSAIADILSNMDRGIEALEQKIEKYRQMKEGAMEELLTGKTRLV